MNRRTLLKTIGASTSVALAGCTIQVPDDWGQVRVVQDEDDTPTQTQTDVPTETDTPTQTQSPTRTETRTETETATSTDTPTQTETDTPTETEQPSLPHPEPLVWTDVKSDIPDTLCPQSVGSTMSEWTTSAVVHNTDNNDTVEATFYVTYKFNNGARKTGKLIYVNPGEEKKISVTSRINCEHNSENVEVDVSIENQERV